MRLQLVRTQNLYFSGFNFENTIFGRNRFSIETGTSSLWGTIERGRMQKKEKMEIHFWKNWSGKYTLQYGARGSLCSCGFGSAFKLQKVFSYYVGGRCPKAKREERRGSKVTW